MFYEEKRDSLFNNNGSKEGSGVYGVAESEMESNTKGDGGSYTLDIDSDIEFNATSESLLTTTDELCQMINQVFHQVFSDYYGSNVIVNNNASLSVNLVFKPNSLPDAGSDEMPKKCITTLVNTIKKTDSEIVNDILGNNAHRDMEIQKNNNFIFTKAGGGIIYGLLAKQIAQGVNPKNLMDMKKKIMNEVYENQRVAWNKSESTIYVRVYGLDIYKILSLIFGRRTEDGSRLFYNTNIKRPLVNTVPSPNGTNYILEIQKMSENSFVAAMNKMGMGPSHGSIQVVTGSYGNR